MMERPFRRIVRDQKGGEVNSETFVDEFRDLVCDWTPRNVVVVYVLGVPGDLVDVRIAMRHMTDEDLVTVAKRIVGAARGHGLTDAQTDAALAAMETP